MRAGTNLGVDHATRPADYPAFAKAAFDAGVRLDLRYLCRVGVRPLNASKLARVDELHAALDAGLAVGLVWQDTKGDALTGATGGRLDGIEAARLAAELGYPRDCVIFVAVDFRPSSAQLPTVDAYFAAFREACPWPIGVYGAGDVIDRLMYLGLAVAGWHVSAWGTTSGAVLRQHGPYLTVGGVQCDPNDVLVDNPPVWHPGGPMDIVDILRRHGVPDVHDERVAGHGVFRPVGVMVHHTGMKGAGLTACKNGRPDLAGPIANINIARNARVNVIADGPAGKAYHAGKGSSVVLGDVRANRPVTRDAKDRHLADDTDGNPFFVGIEVDNDGVGELYPDVQIAALVAVIAALCAELGWAPARAIHHRQWTARKPDMSYHGDLPAMVAALLHPPAPHPSEEDNMDTTAAPSWAARIPADSPLTAWRGRVPFYRLVPNAQPPEVQAWHGAPLNGAFPPGSEVHEAYGIVVRTLPNLAAPPIGIEEVPGGNVVVFQADGAPIDIAHRP